ncbi:hypothetical protein BJX66DRAFT_255543 [Aspergillus keveii]|uniref:Uncharacterized protein n=1 Tax=Aspergillus keveii TaxID=714993 RepID=A0ABR4FYV3_9EURO
MEKINRHNVPSWLIQLSSGPVQCRHDIGRTQVLIATLILGQNSMPHCRQLSRFHHAKIWRNEESRGPMKNLNLAQENAGRRCVVLKKVRGYTFFCLVYRWSEIPYDRSEMVRFQIAAGLWGFGNRKISSCLRAEISCVTLFGTLHSTKLTSSSSGEPSVVETSLSATVTARWTRKEPMIINPWIELMDPT